MITRLPLSSVSPDIVQQKIAEITTFVQEHNPHLALRHGVFADLLVYYHAMLLAQTHDLIDTYLRARSLQEISEDPILAVNANVDDVLSNFRVSRRAGSRASGEVSVVVDSSVTTTIAIGSLWIGNGKQFTATQTFTGKLDAGQVNSPGDRLLVARSDGTWVFTITVEAVEEGPEFTLSKDTQILPTVAPPNFKNGFVTSDFLMGRYEETNAELLTRLQEGISCKAPSNRVNMDAYLRSIPEFADVTNTSIIGMGDAEMLRDKRSIFPIAYGGKVDWYVRSRDRLFRQKITKQASLVEKLSDGFGLWQVTFARDEFPGMYEVRSVRLKDSTVAGSFDVVSDSRGLDLGTSEFTPDISGTRVIEGVYTRYQTVTIQFKDTVTAVANLALLTKVWYDFEAVGLPLIASIQDTLASRGNRSCTADVLVRAAVPGFVRLAFDIQKKSTETTPDLVKIRSALCDLVNAVGFVGELHASRLQKRVYDFLSGEQIVSPIDMFVRLRVPSGRNVFLRSTESVSVPDLAAELTSKRTTQFFLDPADIVVSVRGIVE